MQPSQIISESESKFKRAVEHFEEELKKIRTGRAHPGMLDGVIVTAYGTPMPIIQVGNVTAPEAQLLQITPFDPSNIQAIAAAIRDNPSLGLNPSDDGRVVRVPIPALTEDRRKEIVKQLGGKVEEALITMRGVRHDAMDGIDAAKKDKAVSEDEAKRLSNQIDDMMNKNKAQIDALSAAKEAEVMKV
ncbi:MAG: ribosome-recycling factor [Candidatus Saccharibacteria bacterium]|nr:ribosome-recycling factor [Candidatus Saccharibacteria bacterium]